MRPEPISMCVRVLVLAALLMCANRDALSQNAAQVAAQVQAATQRPADFDHPPATVVRKLPTFDNPVEVVGRTPTTTESGGPAFHVDRIVLVGVTRLSPAEQAGLTRPFERRTVRFGELSTLRKQIEQRYRQHGYFLAQAAVPPQEITGGSIRVEVSEGRYGSVTVDGNEHYSTAFIRRYFAPAQSGGLIRERPLLTGLLELNQLPDLTVQSVFAPGEKPGTSDVILRVHDDHPLHAVVDYNNQGSRLVGRNRVALSLIGGRALVEGDDLTLRVSDPFPGASDPFYQASYARPVGHAYDRIGVQYASAQTRVRGSGLDPLDIRGTADIAGLSWQRPLTVRQDEQTALAIGFTGKNLRNFVLNTTPTSQDKIRMLTATYSINRRREKQQLATSAVLSQGLGTALGGSSNEQDIPSRVGAGNAFTKLNVDATMIRELDSKDFLVLHGSGQIGTRPLVVAEQFAIGGLDSVRGFTQSEALGDDGYALSAELRRDLFKQRSRTVQGAAFVENGEVFRQRPQRGEERSSALTGIGLGLRAFFGSEATVRLDLGLPLSPSRNVDGESATLYAQASYRY